MLYHVCVRYKVNKKNKYKQIIKDQEFAISALEVTHKTKTRAQPTITNATNPTKFIEGSI